MSKATMGFKYRVREFDPAGNLVSDTVDDNLIPTEGLNYFIETALKEGTPFPALYVGLFAGNYTPTPTDTMAAFPAAATELTAYTSATRPVVTLGTVAGGAVDNTAAVNEFTGTVNATLAYGGFVATSPTKGGTSGPLLSAVRFSTPKALDAGGRLEVTVVFASASI
jgi:hypothetical protein